MNAPWQKQPPFGSGIDEPDSFWTATRRDSSSRRALLFADPKLPEEVEFCDFVGEGWWRDFAGILSEGREDAFAVQGVGAIGNLFVPVTIDKQLDVSR
jgi:hypothetical protein